MSFTFLQSAGGAALTAIANAVLLNPVSTGQVMIWFALGKGTLTGFGAGPVLTDNLGNVFSGIINSGDATTYILSCGIAPPLTHSGSCTVSADFSGCGFVGAYEASLIVASFMSANPTDPIKLAVSDTAIANNNHITVNPIVPGPDPTVGILPPIPTPPFLPVTLLYTAFCGDLSNAVPGWTIDSQTIQTQVANVSSSIAFAWWNFSSPIVNTHEPATFRVSSVDVLRDAIGAVWYDQNSGTGIASFTPINLDPQHLPFSPLPFCVLQRKDPCR